MTHGLTRIDPRLICIVVCQGYQWLKERVNSEEGRRQLAKVKELHLLASRLGCTAAQLAIGMNRMRVCALRLCILW